MHHMATEDLLQVILNGSKLPVKTFQDYVNLYLGPGTQRVYEKLGERWEVCISLAEQGQFQQARGLLYTIHALLLTFCRPTSLLRLAGLITFGNAAVGELCQLYLHCQGRHSCGSDSQPDMQVSPASSAD